MYSTTAGIRFKKMNVKKSAKCQASDLGVHVLMYLSVVIQPTAVM